uniref:DUF1977 domain-containing protein n=1 Tax=Astyanax mexicanus TaxID=7994 RepID=A0A8B9KJC3_ASTMX
PFSGLGICYANLHSFLSVWLNHGGGFSMFIQLMPIVVLILVSVLSQLMVSTPPYSLYSRPSTGQTVKRQTENLRVDYYVTRDFKSEYKGSALQKIEKSVEDDYVTNVRNNCWKERQTSTLLYVSVTLHSFSFLSHMVELPAVVVFPVDCGE